MSKRRVFRGSVFNENIVGSNFDNTPSTSIFRLGSFSLDTNLESRFIGDFSNKITTFSKTYTLENIGLEETLSEKIFKNESKLRLNIDFNEISSYARYGSVEDLFKFTIKNIIEKFPYSLRAVNQLNTGIVNTILNFSYNELENISTFRIPTISLINIYGIVVDSNNNIPNSENPLKNFNLSKDKYVVWSNDTPDIEYPVIGFTGNTSTDNFITLSVKGKLFNLNNSTLSKTFHIKPSEKEFLNFVFQLNDIEKYILNKKNTDGFIFKLKDIKEDGRTFFTRNLVWPTSDLYNIDLDTISYNIFINDLIEISKRYDDFKTDTIYRLYTTESLKEFDTTNDQKIKKLIRTYGFEFDKIRRLADGFATLNNISYKKEKSIPDILVKNLAKTLGWEVFDIIQEEDLLNKIFTVGTTDVSKSNIPSEIDIELWRRILINTKWFLKSKGTRKSLETIFKLIGIPDDFILLNEYVYLAENRLELEDRLLSFDDLNETNPSSFDSNGFPIAVDENNRFFFQVSGNTDSGQTYLNRFRENGFVIDDYVDNKKSWLLSRNIEERVDTNTSYLISDSRLLINTKEVDVGLSPSKALEMDIFKANKTLNFPLCSTGVTTNIFYINTALNTNANQQNIFDIPDIPEGDIQVTVNGITLTIDEDYTIIGPNKNRIVLNDFILTNFNGITDIISITYVNDPINGNRNLVEYIVLKVAININNQTIINLPDEPLGEIQLVLNGLTLKPGKTSIDGDYYINPNNRTEIIITSEDINNSIEITDTLSVMYLKELSPTNLLKYTDSYLITSFFNNKLYFNNITNRYIFVSDYTISDIKGIKLTLNGLTLTNNIDFIIDPINKKNIIFSPNIVLKINDVVSAFYLIDTDPSSECINILDINIQEISFTDYIDTITHNLIDVKNRKIITDNNGGTYPKLSFLYDSYIKSSKNSFFVKGYKFNNLYNFIKKFDNHFVNLLNQLLPATSILRKSGLVVSNPVFGLQKYKYIRGINDGSEFTGQTTKLSCDLFDFNTQTLDVKSTEELGSIIINASGFNGFVDYSIDNGEFFSPINEFTNLTAGVYNIVLRDEIGCQITGTTEVNIDCTEFQIVDINIENVKSDTELGSIEIIVSGDTNVQYSIDGGETLVNNNIFNNLTEGVYDIFVLSGIGCERTATIEINVDCDVSISDFTFGSCEASGFLNRDNTNLSIVNDQLALFVSYTFEPDSQFVRYFREKITITETTLPQVLLEKWVEFTVQPNESVVELGNIFLYDVPTYDQFDFELSFTEQTISCVPFTDPLPEDIFTPLPDEPELTYDLFGFSTGEVYNDNGTYQLQYAATISNPLSFGIEVFLQQEIIDDGQTDYITSNIFIAPGQLSGFVGGFYQNSTNQDDTSFNNVCITGFNYTGSEEITLINPCFE